MMNKLLLFFIAVFIYNTGFSQATCDTLGQNPGTAFPVCGVDTFKKESVPACGGRQIITTGCSDVLTDINPFWYRFTCFTGGTLGFVLTPNLLSDDYDWQLFDITNRNAADVYTDASLFVACNWSGEPGITGASAAGNSLIICGSSPGGPFRPLFSAMPTLIQGHEYILLVSHFTTTNQSGYGLSFGGGTASITDPAEPGLASARAICDGVKMTVKLSKKMKCSSLNADGSDFTVTPAFAPIISAVGVNCNNGFDMDSVVLTLASPVPPGNYTITVKNDGTGVNLLDNCNRTIALGQNLSVTVFPLIPTLMDSLTKPGCAPDELQLVFKKPMQCSSIAPDGSDFKISGGSSPITVAGAAGICDASGLTNVVLVKLSGPIQTKSNNLRITLGVGSDGNTLLNECAMQTPVGSFLPFTTKDTVSADFKFTINFGCKADTVLYSHDGRNEVNSWKWSFDNTLSSSLKDTAIIYPVFGNKKASLIVSNGVCSDTSSTVTIPLDNAMKAGFESTAVVCPEDPAIFKDKSTGHIVGWNWIFGNGSTNSLQVPPQQFYLPSNTTTYTVATKLIVKNDIGCLDTATGSLKVVSNCYIAIPKAFTPNGDGVNDYLYPTNAYKARDLYFAVYNRVGQKLFETRDWNIKWDGTFKGNPQDPGTYVWFLKYTNIETNELHESKGSTVLLR